MQNDPKTRLDIALERVAENQLEKYGLDPREEGDHPLDGERDSDFMCPGYDGVWDE